MTFARFRSAIPHQYVGTMSCAQCGTWLHHESPKCNRDATIEGALTLCQGALVSDDLYARLALRYPSIAAEVPMTKPVDTAISAGFWEQWRAPAVNTRDPSFSRLRFPWVADWVFWPLSIDLKQYSSAYVALKHLGLSEAVAYLLESMPTSDPLLEDELVDVPQHGHQPALGQPGDPLPGPGAMPAQACNTPTVISRQWSMPLGAPASGRNGTMALSTALVWHPDKSLEMKGVIPVDCAHSTPGCAADLAQH